MVYSRIRIFPPIAIFFLAFSARAAGPYWNISPSTAVGGASLDYSVGFKGPFPWVDLSAYNAYPGDAIDDTSGIQSAINIAQAFGVPVHSQKGIYNVSSTLQISSSALAGTKIEGVGETATIFYSTGDYGDMMIIGSTTSSSIDSVSLKNIWFDHDFGGYENGLSTTTMVNKPTRGANLVVYGLTRGNIENCMFWNMPVGVHFFGGSETRFVHNNVRSVYDHSKSQLQVSTAGVLLDQFPGGGQVPTAMFFDDTKINGYLSESRSVTYGTATVTQSENIGPQYGFRVNAGEDLQWHGGEYGGQNQYAFGFFPQNGVALLDITISNALMDGNRLGAIGFFNNNGSQVAYNISIAGNVFVGQNNSKFAVVVGAAGDALPSTVGLVLSGNVFTAYAEGVVALYDAKGTVLSGNIIRNYNTGGGNFSSTLSGTAVYVGADSRITNLVGNTLGGGNLFEPFDGVGSNCVYGVFISPSALSSTSYTGIVDGGINTANTIVMSF